ncbi:MAG TPA: hypothetical protein DCZ10_12345 [Pelotomaculum sp.]|nr:hypothetical protein [Pelotomaculum sp.]
MAGKVSRAGIHAGGEVWQHYLGHIYALRAAGRLFQCQQQRHRDPCGRHHGVEKLNRRSTSGLLFEVEDQKKISLNFSYAPTVITIPFVALRPKAL